jgi:hypothetical protein
MTAADKRRTPCAIWIEKSLFYAALEHDRSRRGIAHLGRFGEDLLHPIVRLEWLTFFDPDGR